jgi:integrase
MRSWYTGRAQEWSFKLTAHNRRSAFSLDEYKALVRYMRTAQFLRKGKHGNDRRLTRHRMMLRTYILFMANTGLRVGEARHLKWQDIEERTNKGGRKVVVVRVSRLRGKRRQERNAVGRDTALLALNRWRDYLRGQGEPCRSDDYIFCDERGRTIQHMREGFNSIIREAGVERDKDVNKYTIYCLRHFYITSRLRFGKNVSAHKIAKNCGTSIAMIDKYYSHVIADDFIDDLSI